MNKHRIPATVITGFLGAGKTTLIRNLAKAGNAENLALIINEFGDVGIDAAITRDGESTCAADQIIELANGCICCAVADDFLPAMESLLDRSPSPTRIIIETSGLALPQPLVQAFNWPSIRHRVMLDGVVAVIDGEAMAAGNIAADIDALEAQRAQDEQYDHETPITDLFHDQISAANILVISKTDKIDQNAVKDITERLASISGKKTPVVKSHINNAPLDALFGLGLEASSSHQSHDHDDHDHDDHDHDDFVSAVVTVPPIDNHQDFAKTLAATAREHRLLRAKGFLTVTGKIAPLVAQAVGDRVETYFAAPDTDTANGRLVIIGLKGIDIDAVASQLGGQALAP